MPGQTGSPEKFIDAICDELRELIQAMYGAVGTVQVILKRQCTCIMQPIDGIRDKAGTPRRSMQNGHHYPEDQEGIGGCFFENRAHFTDKVAHRSLPEPVY